MKHLTPFLTGLFLLVFSFSAYAQIEENPKIYLGAGVPRGGVPILAQLGYEKGIFDISALYVHEFVPVSLSYVKLQDSESGDGSQEVSEEDLFHATGIYIGPNLGGALPLSKRFSIKVKAGLGLAIYLPHEVVPRFEDKKVLFDFDFFNMRISPRYYITRKTAIYAEGAFHLGGMLVCGTAGLIFNM